MITMKRKLLVVLAVALWMQWRPAPVSAMRPGCGDGNCSTNSCASSPPGTSPGDGCEEDLCSCPSDCEGISTYAAPNDNYCDSCHGEAGTPDCYVCYPNWVTASDTVVGYIEEDHVSYDPFTFAEDDWCEWLELHDVHQRDANNCTQNQQAFCYTIYLDERHHIGFWGYCCAYLGCSGYQYCPF